MSSNAAILEEDSLLTLNDDCLELIFLQLSHVEQFVMWKLHWRFQLIIERLWFNSLHTVHVEDHQLDVLNDVEYVEFMEIVSSHAVKLSLMYLTKQRIELLIDLCFDKVIILKCVESFVQRRNRAERYGRKAERVLQCCFPNVLYLTQ